MEPGLGLSHVCHFKKGEQDNANAKIREAFTNRNEKHPKMVARFSPFLVMHLTKVGQRTDEMKRA